MCEREYNNVLQNSLNLRLCSEFREVIITRIRRFSVPPQGGAGRKSGLILRNNVLRNTQNL